MRYVNMKRALDVKVRGREGIRRGKGVEGWRVAGEGGKEGVA